MQFTITDAIFKLSAEKVTESTGVPIDTVQLFYWRLRNGDVIANVLKKILVDANEKRNRAKPLHLQQTRNAI